MTEPNGIEVNLDDIELDEQGNTIIMNETLAQAVNDAKNRASDLNKGEYIDIMTFIHSW